MVEDDAAYRFLTGADMDPTAVLARYPGARFVARAALATEAAAGDATGEVWGILIRLPTGGMAGDAGESRPVVTDDGRTFRAAVAEGGRPVGDPPAVLAAARYWELPPAYVRRLEETVGRAAEES